ncbi:FAD-dependent oxidoreductase [Fodinicola feengrottensis]|uniref:FAD-dependent oxidoreductase n=1 Tax=Fodinicola feengrottensis TaxID=435914 RepID=A0ABN2FXB2_9ACTN
MFEKTSVVVVGSGAAGLCAALAAAVAGAAVTVLEGSPKWGGATAVSGGQVWAPGNHHTADNPEDALTYVLGRTQGRSPAMAAAFVRAAPLMVRFLERHTPIRFTPMDAPDSFAEAPGGRAGGRNLEVEPVSLGDLGDPDDLFWPPPFFQPVLTNAEIMEFGLMAGGTPPFAVMKRRQAAGQVTLGQGLVAGLLHGCREAGVELLRDHRVTGLLPEGGVRVGDREFPAPAVVLATGGFEHDAELRERLLDGPYDQPLSPPVNRGDALRLADGAAVDFVSESWSWPASAGPTTWPDGTARPVLMLSERMLPHVIWVNAAGRRFVNESSHNAALAFAETDPGTGLPRNTPAWAIADAQFRARYAFAGAAPGQPLPSHVIQAPTLADLAAKTGIDSAQLAATVQSFNAHAEKGDDPDFGRGIAAYDHYWGDRAAPHPNLGTIAEPPFCALPVLPGLVGTKGGLRTDTDARVLRWNGQPIPGLFAAGNAMAAVIGPAIISPGATIGSALAWGWIAGTAACV